MKYSSYADHQLKISDIIIAMLVLINSGYALTSGSYTLLFLLLATLTVALLLKEGLCLRIPRKDSKLIVLLIMAVSMAISFLVNWEFSVFKVYIHTALFIVNGYLIRLVYTGRQVVNTFIKVLQIAAIGAILVAVVDMVIPINSFAPIVVNGSGKEYYTLGIVSYQTETYRSGKRCCGLFWEPGMFSGMLALATMLDLYTRRDEKQFWRIVTYCTAIFITFSTSGYVYYIMIGLMIMVRNKKRGRSAIALLIIAGAVVIFSSLIQDTISALFELLPLVFDKVKTKNLSYRTRVLSPFADVMLMLKYPFGTGFEDFLEIRTSLMSQMGAKTSITTSTLTYFGVTSGILFFVAYNASWIKGFLTARQVIPLKIFAIMLYALVLTSNPMFNNQMIWIITFMNFSGLGESEGSVLGNRRLPKIRLR